MLESAKGKVAPMARYNVKQLQQFSLEKLIKLILLLQDENDQLRAELEKMRMKVSILDKKSQQIIQLKANIKQNKTSLDQARQALREGHRLIMYISQLIDEILMAFRLPQKKQQITLPQLLRRLKLLLEGHY